MGACVDYQSIQITHMPLDTMKPQHRRGSASVLKLLRASASRDNLRITTPSHKQHIQDTVPREWREMWLWQHLLNCAFQASQDSTFISPAQTIFSCMGVCKSWHQELSGRLLLRLQRQTETSASQRVDFCNQIGLREYDSFFRFLSNLNASPNWHSPEQISTCAMHISCTTGRHRRKKSICICTHSYPVNVRGDLTLPLTQSRRFMVIFVTRYMAGKIDNEQVIVTEIDMTQCSTQHTEQQTGIKLTQHLLTLVTPQLC